MKNKLKINKKVIIAILIALIVQCTFYQLGKIFIDKAVIINSKIDNYIPFIKQFVYFYIIWFPLLIITPYVVSIYDKKNFNRYITTGLISSLVAGIIFILFPTKMIRYEGTFTGLSGFIMKIIYYIDTPTSCLPSMHVILATMFILGVSSKNVPKTFKVFIYIASPLIMLATMFIKQHAFYDVITGIIITIIVWLFAPHTKLFKIVENKMKETK